MSISTASGWIRWNSVYSSSTFRLHIMFRGAIPEVNETLFNMGLTTASRFTLQVNNSGYVNLYACDDSTGKSVTSTNMISENNYNIVSAYCNSDLNSLSIRLNDVFTENNGGNYSPNFASWTSIGNFYDAGQSWNGDIAEVACWNASLTNEAGHALLHGKNPMHVNDYYGNPPKGYLPLIRKIYEDYMTGVTWTEYGTSVSVGFYHHPCIARAYNAPRVTPEIYIAPKYITNAGNIASVESWGSGIMKGVERPDSDTSLGNWTDHTEGTSNIYQAIDEVYPGDSDYIRTPVSGTPSIYQGGLSNISDPGIHTYHVLKYRYRKAQMGMSKTVSITVRLMQGETEIASWNHSNAGETWTTVEQTLTEGQAGNITDYSSLSLKIEAVEV